MTRESDLDAEVSINIDLMNFDVEDLKLKAIRGKHSQLK